MRRTHRYVWAARLGRLGSLALAQVRITSKDVAKDQAVRRRRLQLDGIDRAHIMPLVPFQSADRRTNKLMQKVLWKASRSVATSLRSGSSNQTPRNGPCISLVCKLYTTECFRIPHH